MKEKYMWGRFLIVGAALACVSIAMGAPTTGPTTQPTTRAAADLSTPAGSLRALAVALGEGDAQTIEGLFIVKTPQQKRMLQAIAEMAQAVANLRQAAVAAYGWDEADKHQLGPDIEASTAQALADIDAAEITINGDRAAVRYLDDKNSPKILKKVGDVWKVPIEQLGTPDDEAALDQRLADLAAQARLAREITEQIAAGKLPTAEKAAETWHARIFQVSTSQPATHPAPVHQKDHG